MNIQKSQSNPLPGIIKPEHLGYAVQNLEKSLRIFLYLGFTQESEICRDEERHVALVFLRSGEMRIELIAPLDDRSPVDTYLKKIGNTPYHICYKTTAMDEAMEALRKRRFIMIEKPGVSDAFHGRRVAFLYHIDYGLLELVEA